MKKRNPPMGNNQSTKEEEIQKLKAQELEELKNFFSDLKNLNQAKKIFAYYDKDNSGFIDETEYPLFIQKVQEISSDNERIARYFDKFKNLSCLDFNNDGKISFEEFLNSTKQVIPKKILLLGTCEAGKSTLVKQFIVWDQNKDLFFQENFHNTFKNQFFETMVTTFQWIGQGMKEFDSEENKLLFDNLGKLQENQEKFDSVKKIWDDSFFNEEFRKDSTKSLVFENFEDFLKVFEKFNPKSFEYSLEELMRFSIKTRQIYDYQAITNRNIHLIDQGGSKNERTKWLKYLKKVDYYCFVVSLSEFDQTLLEDSKTNRSKDSITIFEDILSSKEISLNLPVILIFTKVDLLTNKLKDESIFKTFQSVFPQYEKDNDPSNVMNFFKDLYYKAFQKSGFSSKFFPYFCNALEEGNTKFLFDCIVKDFNINN